MTPPSARRPDLRVTLLHNYRDEQQPSMRLYAERLGQALVRRHVTVTRLRPPGVVPAAWRRAVRRAGTRSTATSAASRSIHDCLRGLETDVAHVVDHGQGYLVAGLDARRTVVTCHDVILLVLAAGRIGTDARPARLRSQLFRISLELMKRAAVVVADSTQTKRDLVDFTHIDPDKVDRDPPGSEPVVRAADPATGWRCDDASASGRGPSFCRSAAGSTRTCPASSASCTGCAMTASTPASRASGHRCAGTERALAERLGVLAHIVELGAVAGPRICRRSTTPSMCCCFRRSTRDSAGRRSRRWPRARPSSARARARSTR